MFNVLNSRAVFYLAGIGDGLIVAAVIYCLVR